jgi:hypothetical protein
MRLRLGSFFRKKQPPSSATAMQSQLPKIKAVGTQFASPSRQIKSGNCKWPSSLNLVISVGRPSILPSLAHPPVPQLLDDGEPQGDRLAIGADLGWLLSDRLV